ncbi:hypothetical protein JW758_06120 [Candidatus Peregrinibacteria bacterium]|nr:hypothetical protein [Candidatus Peregrinibacteria bacterium]
MEKDTMTPQAERSQESTFKIGGGFRNKVAGALTGLALVCSVDAFRAVADQKAGEAEYENAQRDKAALIEEQRTDIWEKVDRQPIVWAQAERFE